MFELATVIGKREGSLAIKKMRDLHKIAGDQLSSGEAMGIAQALPGAIAEFHRG